MKNLIRFSPLLSYALPIMAFAQSATGVPTTFGTTTVTSTQGIADLLCKVAFWMYVILIFVGIIFAMYAAYLYLFSQGDPEKTKQANQTLIYVAVAVVVAIIARFAPSIILSAVGNGTNSVGCS